MSDSKKEFKYHPIQLKEVKVLNLSIATTPKNECDITSELLGQKFGFFHTHSEYDEINHAFGVKVAAVIDEETDGDSVLPFTLKVELAGVFAVDEQSFPMDKVELFARQNAPLILYPYLREHVYSLTMRAGFDPTMLPLFEVPAFRLNK